MAGADAGAPGGSPPAARRTTRGPRTAARAQALALAPQGFLSDVRPGRAAPAGRAARCAWRPTRACSSRCTRGRSRSCGPARCGRRRRPDPEGTKARYPALPHDATCEALVRQPASGEHLAGEALLTHGAGPAAQRGTHGQRDPGAVVGLQRTQPCASTGRSPTGTRRARARRRPRCRPTSRHQVTRPERSVRKARVPAVPGLALRGRATVRQPVRAEHAAGAAPVGARATSRLPGRPTRPPRSGTPGAGGQDAGDAVGAPGQGERVEVGAGGAGAAVAGQPAAEGDRALLGRDERAAVLVAPRRPGRGDRVPPGQGQHRAGRGGVPVGSGQSAPGRPAGRAHPGGVGDQSRRAAQTCGRRPRRGYPRRRQCTRGPSGRPGGSTRRCRRCPPGTPGSRGRPTPSCGTARPLASSRRPAPGNRAAAGGRADPAAEGGSGRRLDPGPVGRLRPGSTFTRPGLEVCPAAS